MADYYPLIAKAVAGLDKSTGEARRALYERARNALLAQLRGLTPALSESEITRERLALEEAIRKVETEAARRARMEAAAPRSLKTAAAAPSSASSPSPASSASPAAPSSAAPPSPPAVPAPPPSPASAEPPAESVSPPPGPQLGGGAPAAPPVAEPPARKGGQRSLSDRALENFRTVVAEAESLGEATVQAGRTAREAFAAARAPNGELERIEPHVEPDGLRPAIRAKASRTAPAHDMREARDPAPPVPDELEFAPRSARFSAEHAAPLPLNDEPPEFITRPLPPVVEPQARPRPRVKAPRQWRSPVAMQTLRRWANAAAAVLLLAGLTSVAYWQWPNLSRLARSGTSFVQTPTKPAQPPAPGHAKIADRLGAQSESRAPDTALVAQRVVLYEEDPADPAGKRFVGSAVWKTESVAAGPGQPSDLAVRAEIEIPERQVTMRLSLRRNRDKALPASHTIEIMFTLPNDFAHGGISNIPGILMKQSEQTRGVPLAGLAVKVTTGFFLIGLSAVESDMQRNLQLLKERAWFDVPVVYTDGRRAILAVEKGTPGERAFADAFAAWNE